jgi:hypothetical protein
MITRQLVIGASTSSKAPSPSVDECHVIGLAHGDETGTPTQFDPATAGCVAPS